MIAASETELLFLCSSATFCPSIISVFSLLPICGKEIQQLPYTQTVVHRGHCKDCSKKLAVHEKGQNVDGRWGMSAVLDAQRNMF